MNTLSPIRSGLNPLTSLPGIRPDAATARVLRPGDLRELAPTQAPTATPETKPAGNSTGSFSSLLGRMVDEVNSKQINAAQTVANLQSGGTVSLHQAMISMEEASLSFQLMAEVRNKLLESYQEIMRMQV